MREIDTAKSFIEGKSGKKYFFTKGISVGRKTAYSYYENHVYFGNQASDTFKNIKRVLEEDLAKNVNFAQAAHRLYNILEGIGTVADKRPDAVMFMAAIFFNEEGEDLSKWDEEEAKKKIDDWADINWLSFFQFVCLTVPGLMADFQEISRNGLKNELEKKKTSLSDSGNNKKKK